MPSVRTGDLPHFHDYNAALAFYNQAKRWRDYITDGDRRPLDRGTYGRRKKHMSIRVDGGVVLCQLYSTDVVSFYPNGVIEVDLNYVSQSTSGFATAILPGPLGVSGDILWLSRWTRGYRPARREPLRIHEVQGRYELVPNSAFEPFTHCTLNRAVTKKAYAEYPIREFRDWLAGCVALKRDFDGYNAIDRYSNRHGSVAQDLLKGLTNRKLWPDVANWFGIGSVRRSRGWGHNPYQVDVKRVVRRLQNLIISHTEGAIIETKVDFADDYKHANAMRHSRSKYSWSV